MVGTELNLGGSSALSRPWQVGRSDFVKVQGFIDRKWLVEVEADCIADN